MPCVRACVRACAVRCYGLCCSHHRYLRGHLRFDMHTHTTTTFTRKHRHTLAPSLCPLFTLCSMQWHILATRSRPPSSPVCSVSHPIVLACLRPARPQARPVCWCPCAHIRSVCGTHSLPLRVARRPRAACSRFAWTFYLCTHHTARDTVSALCPHVPCARMRPVPACALCPAVLRARVARGHGTCVRAAVAGAHPRRAGGGGAWYGHRVRRPASCAVRAGRSRHHPFGSVTCSARLLQMN
jgi:hypothetical protein